jgi:hypothetical protein
MGIAVGISSTGGIESLISLGVIPPHLKHVYVKKGITIGRFIS